MMLRSVFLVLILPCLAVGQTPNQRPNLFAGCYNVSSLSESPPGEGSELIPRQFALLDEPKGKSAFFGMRSLGTGRNDFETLWTWRQKSADEIEINFSNGLGGFRGTLKKTSGGDFTGKLRQWCDYRCGPKRRVVAVHLHRIACAAN
jgi:hypothetical protein